MKKFMNYVLVPIVAAGLLIGVNTGCELTNAQQEVVAQNGGMLVATAWIAIDNPSSSDISNVASTVDMLVGATENIEAGEPVSNVLYPIAADWISKNVEPQSQPLALAGTIAILTGVDMYFTVNPDDLNDRGDAVRLTKAFLKGAKTGLTLSPTSPLMLRAMESHKLRSQALEVK